MNNNLKKIYMKKLSVFIIVKTISKFGKKNLASAEFACEYDLEKIRIYLNESYCKNILDLLYTLTRRWLKNTMIKQ